ncbi:hypothetical protein [Streptosporangium sandarakinum]|uniref:hypothetical protein n=1 Tax=Streptosporangium sandarakinum TaxID=1260955 RepID=UPI00371987B6
MNDTTLPEVTDLSDPSEAAPVPAGDAPIEGTVIPPAEPIPAEDVADDVDDAEEEEAPEGVPAAHLAAGGLSAASVALGAVYQLVGLPGLIGGGVLAGGSAVAYARHRYQRRQRRMAGVSWEAGRTGNGGKGGRRATGLGAALRSEGRSSRTTRTTSGGGLLGGRAGRVSGSSRGSGLRDVFGGRRTGSGSSSAGRSAGGRAAGGERASAASRSAGRSTSRHGKAKAAQQQRGPVQAVRQAAATTGKAARNFARLTRAAGTGTARTVRAGATQVRKAAERVDAATGGRAGRAYRAVTRQARRAVRATGRAAAAQARKGATWADRRTGRRVSTAWHAARGAGGFTAARRRAAAVLGSWDAQLTASLVALVALLVDRVRARQARKVAAAAEQAEQEAKAAAEVAEDGGDGPRDPALTRLIACPRCGGEHTVTIPADEFDTWISCGCGLRICVYRAPIDPPDHVMAEEMAADSGADARRRPPHTTASPTHTRRNRMSANPLAAAAAEVNAVAAAHAPVDMFAVARELDQLYEVPANIAMALRTYTSRLQGEYPINPTVVEAIHQLYAGLAQLVPVAEEIGPLFRTIHADDLKREEAPRTNEQLWNV